MPHDTQPPHRPWSENVPEWAASLPTPRSNPPQITAADVAQLIRTQRPGVDFLVVDLRREDWKVRNRPLSDPTALVLVLIHHTPLRALYS